MLQIAVHSRSLIVAIKKKNLSLYKSLVAYIIEDFCFHISPSMIWHSSQLIVFCMNRFCMAPSAALVNKLHLPHGMKSSRNHLYIWWLGKHHWVKHHSMATEFIHIIALFWLDSFTGTKIDIVTKLSIYCKCGDINVFACSWHHSTEFAGVSVCMWLGHQIVVVVLVLLCKESRVPLNVYFFLRDYKLNRSAKVCGIDVKKQ